MVEHLKHGLDAASAATAIGALAGILPPIASLLSIIWLTIQMRDYYRKKREIK